MAKVYWRPIAQSGSAKPTEAITLAGGWAWFTHCEAISRNKVPEIVPASEVPDEVLADLSNPKRDILGLPAARPLIMGILNATPDSFSDGGKYFDAEAALAQAAAMVEAGADILDVGGESTRPGADYVSVDEEIARTVPIVTELRNRFECPISIDTRKAEVAKANQAAGATLFNDVSALTFDPGSIGFAASHNMSVCLMHASGDPKTMQNRTDYTDVILDVYDYLQDRRDAAIDAGIDPAHIILDPGIGFGKNVGQNIRLLNCLSLFHTLGCPILLGASRKRFIGELTSTPEASERMPGSVAVAIEAVRQGAQIVRVHDVAETRQALTMWEHITTETF